MGLSGVSVRNGLVVLMLGLGSGWGSGCATTTSEAGWPAVDVQARPPEKAERGEAGIERGADGQLYLVGYEGEEVSIGARVIGRLGGEWPLQSEAPALFGAEVVEVGQGYQRLQPLYMIPETDLDALDVEISDDEELLRVGKGIGRVGDIDYTGPTHLTIDLGQREGVQAGDFYAIFDDPQGESARSYQLTRRFIGVCMIVDRGETSSACRLWQGHPAYEWSGVIEAGKMALFLEPTFGRAPREAVILVNRLEDAATQERIESMLRTYLERIPGTKIGLEVIDEAVDPQEVPFYRWNQRIHREEPAVLLGLGLVTRNGKTHLHVNYTGIGPAVGPGMVAAPPEGGIDLGEVGDLGMASVSGLAAVVSGAVMVYRGENALALSHFNEALQSETLQGVLRWHARDQYLMRWAAMDRLEEALWLVAEDQAVAISRGQDERAYQNALGTAVRLFERIESYEQAQELAAEYLEARAEDRPQAAYLSARAMYAEMAMLAGATEEAEASTGELMQLCPDGCSGDLVSYLAGIFWSAYTQLDQEDFNDRLLARMVEVGQSDSEVMAGARMLQGWQFLATKDYEQALIAFLESERLYRQSNLPYGEARSQFYIALVQIARQEYQDAFERAMVAMEYMEAVGDVRTRARILERISAIYFDLSEISRSDNYLGAAVRVFGEGVEAQLALGNYKLAAEGSFGFGRFMFQVRQFEQARGSLARSVILGLKVGHYETVALSHLFLAMIAREEGDQATFEAEVGRARLMAELAGDPMINEVIESVISPGQGPEDPTQLL